MKVGGKCLSMISIYLLPDLWSLTPTPSPKERGVVCLKGIEKMSDRKRGEYCLKNATSLDGE